MNKNILNRNLDNYEKILSCFLLTNPYNIVTNMGSNNFAYFYEPTNDNIYKVNTISKNNKMLETMVNSMYRMNYLYYHTLDVDKESISMINNIHPKLFENLYSIYNMNTYGKKINTLILQDTNMKKVPSYDYKKQLKEIVKDVANTSINVNMNVKMNPNIDKINIFNKKIKEIMN
jgi:hypothetical protein